MKFLLALIVMFQASAFAEVIIDRPMSRELPLCGELGDVGNKDLILSVLKEEVDEDKRTITFKVNLYNCFEVPAGFGFREITPETETGIFIVREDKLVSATVTINSIKFYTYNNSKELVVAELRKDGADYVVSLTVDTLQTRVGIGSTINSDFRYKDELILAGFIKKSRATIVTIK